MRFQTKLLVTYSILVLFLVTGVSIGFFMYSSRIFERNARSTYGLIADKIAGQFETQYRSMEFIETSLISSASFRGALEVLVNIDRSDPLNKIDINDAILSIRSSLLTYANIKNFYALVVYTPKGDFFSSNFLDHDSLSNVAEKIPQLPWTARAVGLSGKRILLAPYEDPWKAVSPHHVFGLVRCMPGSHEDLGFIEVQNSDSILQKIFSVPDPSYATVMAWTESGELFYESAPMDDRTLTAYRNAADGGTAATIFPYNPATGRHELIIRRTLPESGLSVVFSIDRAILLEPLKVTWSMTAAVGIFIFAFSLAFNWISSRQLTLPLRQIQKQMENTSLQNLPRKQHLRLAHDEIFSLNEAFQQLRGRLDDSITKEIRARTQGIQTQLDSLQAQVNPHFLYNILTVIANKGLELGDLEIGDICGDIASMLRYSTSTAKREATIGEEVRHVETYLSLMKKRYENRLSYSIRMDDALLEAVIPKIILQPIVENSVNHGFQNVSRPMEIRLRGYLDDDRWTIEFCDNGQGFDASALKNLENLLQETDRCLKEGGLCEGLCIGGLGLRNTYGRLRLFFGDRVGWVMENREEGGARIVISAPRVNREESHD